MLIKKTFRYTIAFLAISFSTPAFAVSPECRVLFKETAFTLPSLATSFVDAQVAQVLRGQQLPSWQSFDQIKKLQVYLTEHKLSQEEKKALRDITKTNFELFAKSSDENGRRIFVDKAYRYFEFLEKTNKLVGADIFPARSYLKLAPTDAELIAQAEATVSQQVQRFRQYYHLSGLDSPSELVENVSAYPVVGMQALELVNDGLNVAIHRPEGGRFWIPLTGFQNQRVTGSSKGSYNPDYRDEVESALTFQGFGKYQDRSVRYKPQYGEAIPLVGTAAPVVSVGASHYGSDLYFIKKEVLEKRATWTPIDSFSQPRATAIQTDWNQLFIPWVHREFIAPYLLEYLKRGSYYPSSVPDGLGFKKRNYGSCYVETQIWGPVTLNDVDNFGFKGNVPDPAFLKELRSYGIKIWDMRVNPAKLYEDDLK